MKNQTGFRRSCHIRASLAALVALLTSPYVARAGTPVNTLVATIPVGSEPLGVVVSPDSSTVYVANFDSKSVSVIDAATNTVSSVISTDSFPSKFAISPDGGTLYASCAFSEIVDVISTATKAVTSAISLNSNNSQILSVTLTPDGSELWCPEYQLMHIIDTSLKKVSGTINLATGYFPVEVVFTPNGADAYTIGSDHILDHIDPTTKSVVSTKKLAGRVPDIVNDILMNPVKTQFYVSSAVKVSGVRECRVWALNSTNEKMIWRTDFPSPSISGLGAVTADGNYLYVTCAGKGTPESTIHTVDTATGAEVGRPFTLNNAGLMATAPNGHYAYVCDGSAGTVYVVDVHEQ
jgi:YVTN family beta-propeller protein